MNEIAANVLKEDPRAIARLISFTENGDIEASKAMKDIHRFTGNAHVIKRI